MAAWLFVCGLTYAARLLTDGFIPDGQIRKLADLDNAQELADRLVSAGLWQRCDGGFQIHDYLDYNPSAEKVKGERRAAQERMRKARSPELRPNNDDVRPNKPRSSEEVRPTPSRPIPDPDAAEAGDPPPVGPPLGADAPVKPKSARPARIDPAWEPDDTLRSWATAKHFTPSEVAAETERFRDHYVAKGEPRADWSASFRNWMTSPIRAREAARASPRNGAARGSARAAADPDGFFELAAEYRQRSPP